MPDNIFFNDIVPNIGLYDDMRTKPLLTLSDIEKEFLYVERDGIYCSEKKKTLCNQYIKVIKNLSCNSWYANYLSKDVIFLSVTCKKLYTKIFTQYEQEVNQYRKNQLCIIFQILGVQNKTLRRVHSEKVESFEYHIKKKLCKKKCTLQKETVLLDYFANYDKETKHISILLGCTIGHGSCQENEIFLDTKELFNDPSNLQFNCKKFGAFLYKAAYYFSNANPHTLCTVFTIANYIKQKSSLRLKCQKRMTLRHYASIDPNKIDFNEAIVVMNDKSPGRKSIILPFFIDIRTKNLLKLFLLLPMFYTWDIDNHETHRIFGNFAESYPTIEPSIDNDLKFIRHLDILNRTPEIALNMITPLNLDPECRITTELPQKTAASPSDSNTKTECSNSEPCLNTQQFTIIKKTLNNSKLYLIIMFLFLSYTFNKRKRLISKTI